MKTGTCVVRELLCSFFLFLLLPVELRGLVGAAAGTGQGRVLLPWLLKPEVAVEEGEKPPLTRAERRHSAAHIKRPAQLEQSAPSVTFQSRRRRQRRRTRAGEHGTKSSKCGYECRGKPLGDDFAKVLKKKRLLLWCVASSSAVRSDNLHLQWSCWLCGWLGLLHVLLWLACGGWQ